MARALTAAGVSLYRALLKQCSQLPLPSVSSASSSKPRSALSSIVRFRFKKDKKLDNWQQIRNALQLGRGALRLLQAAGEGSSKALNELAAIASSSVQVATRNSEVLRAVRAEQSTAQLPRRHAEAKEREIRLADTSNYRRHPDTVPVLQRPVPYEQALKHEDGRRKVPHFFVTSGIPFLRYTHKQPLALSRLIAQQLRASEKTFSMKEKHNAAIDMAKLEDDWDKRLWEEHGLRPDDESGDVDDPFNSWTLAHYDARRENAAILRKMDTERQEYGRKLFDVFLKEKKLAEQENDARRAAKRMAPGDSSL